MKKQIENILSYWYHMEYFAPNYPQKKNSIIINKEGVEDFPWLKENNSSYEVYLGKIPIVYLVDLLNEALKEKSVKEKNKSPICVCGIKVDSTGTYVKESFKVNTFFFASTLIIKNKSLDVNISDEAISKFEEEMDSYISDSYPKIHEREQLSKVLEKVCNKVSYKYDDKKLGIINEKRKDSDSENDEDTKMGKELEMMSSFYAKDIDMILKNVREGDKICRYIKSLNNNGKEKIHIDTDINEMKKWLSPNVFPMGKWPSIYSPSLMQQLSINIAISDEKDIGDVFSVNGPPGTGKTTLLKEIIASYIVDRAKILAESDPNSFFKEKVLSNPHGGKELLAKYYEVPESIKKYGIIVASNNNAAVQNITDELPKASDVEKSKTYTGLFDVGNNDEIYFTDMATELLEDGNRGWGLISAKLGKKSNIYELNKLIAPCFKYSMLNKYYTSQDKSWENVSSDFLDAWNKVTDYRKHILDDVNLLNSFKELKIKADEAKCKELNIKKLYQQSILQKKSLDDSIKSNEQKTSLIEENIIYIRKHMTFIQKILILFNIGEMAKEISSQEKEKSGLVVLHCRLVNELDEVIRELNNKEKQLGKAGTNTKLCYSAYTKAKTKLYDSEDSIAKKYGKNFADDNFFNNITENEESQTACPWTNSEYDTMREELFYKALAVQKSFVLSSGAVKQNINMLNNLWKNNKFNEEQKRIVFPQVFATLSLLIPIVSTTFASVEQFLKYVGKGELGTLVIDESGQATPQSALGALWRTRKAIIVGDTLQVEPTVTVPNSISQILIKRYEISNEYGKSNVSVQKMADEINPFSGKINGTTVGCPLVIHRRCIAPMFDISNRISYGGRMFNQTQKQHELFNECDKFVIKRSYWLDIVGKEIGNRNHYVAKQGDEVMNYFDKAVEKYGKDILSLGQKKLYIISPFKTVVVELQKKIFNKFKKDHAFEGIKEEDIRKKWLEKSIGTVHTFQGKEADEVLFVLGCDKETGSGAAMWVGKKANILNVAVTRAKYRIVVIGDKSLWKDINNFDVAIAIFDSMKK